MPIPTRRSKASFVRWDSRVGVVFNDLWHRLALTEASYPKQDTAADRRLLELMSQTAQRVLDSEASGFIQDRAYDIALAAAGELSPLANGDEQAFSGAARHGSDAYLLWVGVAGLLDAPTGPLSEDACNRVAAALANDWLPIDSGSTEAVRSFFERWDDRGLTFQEWSVRLLSGLP